MSYSFHKEDTKFIFRHKELIINWLDVFLKTEKKKLGDITYVFCSDKYLLSINKQYLKHNYFTDIITFDYTEGKVISGDIFISVDRVADNAKTYKTTFQNELLRVIIHGVLHLAGYTDKTSSKARQMREKEDYYLSLWAKMK